MTHGCRIVNICGTSDRLPERGVRVRWHYINVVSRAPGRVE